MIRPWLVLATAVGVGCAPGSSAPPPSGAVATSAAKLNKQREDRMSAMGRIARHHALRLERRVNPVAALHRVTPFGADAPNTCGNEADCADEDQPFVDPDVAVPLGSGQAETSIAIDRSGQHIVIGYNDFRGFRTVPISVSGV